MVVDQFQGVELLGQQEQQVQETHLLHLQLKALMVVLLIVEVVIHPEVVVEQYKPVFLLLMEIVVDKVEMVEDYQQLLVLMVFLVEVIDITLEGAAEVDIVVED